MNAVAAHPEKPRSKDISEIAKMVLIGAITLVLMAFATLGSTAARAENEGPLQLTNLFSPSRTAAKTQTRRGVLAKVDISEQRMRVYVNGRHQHTFKVSTGARGYVTPTGTWSAKRMHKMWYSRKYDNAPMAHSIFFHRGYAVHATNQISRLGRPASHGCIRLHPRNARMLFNTVKRHGMRNTRVTITR